MDITHAYAATVTKAERDAAGDLIVYGKATGPDIDLDAQICDPKWLKSAMPKWMTWGNLREMHQPIAAGIGIELAAEGDDWMLKSKVVDDGTAKKIEAGALKGYSVGIKNAQVVKDAQAPGGRIVGGEIVEVSYVDRPCNPTATMAIAKAAGAQEVLAPVDTAGHPILGSDDQQDGFDRARAVRLVKAIAADGTVDEQPDIEGAAQAIALIAGLIQAEAAELAAGCYDETYDISLLLRAVEALKVFLARERAGTGTTAMSETAGYLSLAAGADTTKGPAGESVPGAATLEGLASQVAELGALVKRAYSKTQRDEAAGSGEALPDGSFPIKTREDLKNAIGAVGRAKDPAAARRHIISRARALEAADLVPQDWTKAAVPDTIKLSEIADLVRDAVAEATRPLEERAKTLEAELAKVKATPIPGGPVITRTAVTTPARGEAADKAAYYRQQAGQVTDAQARAGYLKLAADAERGLTADGGN
ncbi:hypothetical protein DQ384_38170 [Sphaerisporangium album]|uniref:Uncharacterized protein n=1 Tax=Sphaerisporangium album TaxID=509200 RepID=A0A367ELW9_9ACTN|nr:hypothetical protein [Sphaerisporangium album]RCG19108.1 hypothetical protein DQ384_38170 [Sphaerisporangium album]